MTARSCLALTSLFLGCLPIAYGQTPVPVVSRPGSIVYGQGAEDDLFSPLEKAGYARIQAKRLTPGYLAVPVGCGKSKLSLMLDTGAAISGFDRERTKAMSLAWKPSGAPGFEYCYVDGFDIDAIKTERIVVGSRSMDDMNSSLLRIGEAPLDGLFGIDSLSAHSAVIDFAGARFFLSPKYPADANAAIAKQTREAEFYRRLERSGYDSIPLQRKKSGALTLPVRFGDATVTLMLDTGAPLTSFDRDRTKNLNWRSDTSVPLQPSYVVDDFRVGNIQVSRQLVLASDLSACNAGIQAWGSEPIDGVLGGDFLRSHAAIIDCKGGRLYLLRERNGESEPTAAPKSTPSIRAQAAEADPLAILEKAGYERIRTQRIGTGEVGGMLTVPVLCERTKLSLILDTGAAISCLDPVRIKEMKLALNAAPHDRNVSYAVIDGFEFGKIRSGRSWVRERSMSDDNKCIRPGEGPVDGLLGLDVLRPASAVIDIGRGNVFVLPKSTGDPNSAAPQQPIGIELSRLLEQRGYVGIRLERAQYGQLGMPVRCRDTTLWMGLDSAARVTSFDLERTKGLNLQWLREDGSIPRCWVSGLEIANIRPQRVLVGGYDLTSINHALAQLEERPVDGLLGYRFLQAYSAIIDVAGERLFLTREPKVGAIP